MIAALSSLTGLSVLWARVAATGGLVALVLSAWAGFAYHYQKVGEARVIAKIEKASDANVKKAAAARLSVEGIPAADLNDRYRRD